MLLHGPTALIGHAAAALALAWWLRRGEAAAWTLIRAVAVGVLDRLLAVLPFAVVTAATRAAAPGAPAPRPVSPVAGVRRRGPPAAAVVA